MPLAFNRIEPNRVHLSEKLTSPVTTIFTDDVLFLCSSVTQVSLFRSLERNSITAAIASVTEVSDKSAALWLFDSLWSSIGKYLLFITIAKTPTTTDRTCGGQRRPMTMWFSGKCLRGTVRKNNLRARREAINYLSSVDERRPETGNGSARCEMLRFRPSSSSVVAGEVHSFVRVRASRG